MSKRADLRICGAGSCMFVFKKSEHSGGVGCPMCGFGSYGARWAFGDIVYTWYKTQDKYIENKTNEFASDLRKAIGVEPC